MIYSLRLVAVILTCSYTPAGEALEHEKQTVTQWQFQSFTCAFGCDPIVDEILKTEIGKKLDFNNPRQGFDLFTECNDKLTLKVKVESSSDVIGQLNQTINPEQQFTPENTGLLEVKLKTARAICMGEEKAFTTFWVVNLTPDKMTVYYEGASFLNFTAVK